MTAAGRLRRSQNAPATNEIETAPRYASITLEAAGSSAKTAHPATTSRRVARGRMIRSGSCAKTTLRSPAKGPRAKCGQCQDRKGQEGQTERVVARLAHPVSKQEHPETRHRCDHEARSESELVAAPENTPQEPIASGRRVGSDEAE